VRSIRVGQKGSVLDGKTPAEACGIKVEGKNKWLTLIQNASKTEMTSVENMKACED